MSRLMIKKMITQKEVPCSSQSHSILNAYDIILYYNSIIKGFINFYIRCLTNPQYINYLIYLLNTSCLHTLALKYRTSISNILQKFGKPPTIDVKIDNKVTKSAKLIMTTQTINPIIEQAEKRNIILYDDLKRDLNSLSILIQNEDIKDPFSFKFLNWRAGAILKASNCCICRVSNNRATIQIHHTKHIAKDKTNGFSQIIQPIN